MEKSKQKVKREESEHLAKSFIAWIDFWTMECKGWSLWRRGLSNEQKSKKDGKENVAGQDKCQ